LLLVFGTGAGSLLQQLTFAYPACLMLRSAPPSHSVIVFSLWLVFSSRLWSKKPALIPEGFPFFYTSWPPLLGCIAVNVPAPQPPRSFNFLEDPFWLLLLPSPLFDPNLSFSSPFLCDLVFFFSPYWRGHHFLKRL